MGKYFSVEIKPTIPHVAAGQHAAFANGDVLFDWFSFEIPKGTCRIIGASVDVRPKGDSGAAPNKFGLELKFAKPLRGAAPTTIGTVNSAPSAGTLIAEQLVGNLEIAGGDYTLDLDSSAFAIPSSAKVRPFFFESESAGQNAAYDTYYVAGIAGGDLDFRSETLINNGDLNGPILTVSGTDPRNFLAIGDTIAVTTTADTSVAKSMGIIKSFDSSTQLTLESAFTTGDVVHQDIVYNVAPLTIRLHLER
tara:strand:- start:773 stop:1522 length:750 start_codon:yes stop_codon:yes gene_type:complete